MGLEECLTLARAALPGLVESGLVKAESWAEIAGTWQGDGAGVLLALQVPSTVVWEMQRIGEDPTWVEVLQAIRSPDGDPQPRRVDVRELARGVAERAGLRWCWMHWLFHLSTVELCWYDREQPPPFVLGVLYDYGQDAVFAGLTGVEAP